MEKLTFYKYNCSGKFIIYFNLYFENYLIFFQIGSSEEKKFHLLFLGGFFGSEGVGSEMVLNTAEHLMAAFEIGEHKHIQILRNAVVHVIPVLDDNFDSIIQNYR